METNTDRFDFTFWHCGRNVTFHAHPDQQSAEAAFQWKYGYMPTVFLGTTPYQS